MLLTLPEFIVLLLSFLFIATVYSSVGFGGGSSYLAILTVFFTSFFAIRSVTLVCNLIVVAGSSFHYFKNNHLNFKKFLPFIITSIPLAFLGAQFKLSEHTFFIILGIALIGSAIALIYQTIDMKRSKMKILYPSYVSYLLGAGIGLLSGIVGIGGGIFLAPILNHMKWETSIKIAALASFFILVNSISGIGGLVSKGTFELPWLEAVGLVIAVFVGGQIGIRLSIKKLTGKGLKIITAILVLLVGIRVLILNIL